MCKDKLINELTQLDAQEYAQETKRGRGNSYRLSLYLEAADACMEGISNGAAPETAFAAHFNATRGMHKIAKRLGLALDVQRGNWVQEGNY